MRILHVMASCACVSGVAQTVMNYYRQISSDISFDFLVFWDESSSFRQEIEQMGGRLFLTPEPSICSLRKYWRFVDHFFAEHANEYDAVQLHDLYLNPVIFPIAKKYGVNVRIAHSHSSKFSESSTSALRNWLLYRSLPCLSTHFWAASRIAGKTAFGARIDSARKITVVNNAISIERFAYSASEREKIRRELGISDDAFVLGHIGRFTLQKNHEFLLRVFSEVKQQRPDSYLLLIGADGTLLPSVRRQASELGIADSVIFTGLRSDIGALLSAMDAFCLPSRFEGLGIALIEAQANGLPCLSSDHIPSEAKILPMHKQLSLHDPANQWADTLLSFSSERFKNPENLVTKHGFNIEHEACMLVDRYQKITDAL